MQRVPSDKVTVPLSLRVTLLVVSMSFLIPFTSLLIVMHKTKVAVIRPNSSPFENAFIIFLPFFWLGVVGWG